MVRIGMESTWPERILMASGPDEVQFRSVFYAGGLIREHSALQNSKNNCWRVGGYAEAKAGAGDSPGVNVRCNYRD